MVSLFKSNFSVYEAHNSGASYNFGYLLGLACFFGGGGNRATCRIGSKILTVTSYSP